MSKSGFLLHEGIEVRIDTVGIREIKVLEHLGSGGFADVWKVKDLATSTIYVLKHVRVKVKDKKEKELLIKRINNEASVKIPSRYIVACVGLKEVTSDNFALLFPFIEGRDFSAWIHGNKSSPWENKKRLFIEILKGVNDAHRLNIIHRDLKPDNVLITSDNKPKIIDFGLAKFKDRGVTETGNLGGTFPYMDPAAFIRGIKYVDARADVYAMGVVLYDLVMGMNYWIANGVDILDIFRAIGDKKRNILEIDKAFDFREAPEVEDIIRQSTMFDPTKRTKTINEMIRQLGGIPDERPDIAIDFNITSPVLVVEDGSAKGSMNVITIPDGGEKKLGRMNLDATNSTLSKEHAVIYRRGNSYYLYDDESKNGTYLNGSAIGVGRENKVRIKHTDRIRFADLWTRFVFLKK